jgi:hypothetical protein
MFIIVVLTFAVTPRYDKGKNKTIITVIVVIVNSGENPIRVFLELTITSTPDS